MSSCCCCLHTEQRAGAAGRPVERIRRLPPTASSPDLALPLPLSLCLTRSLSHVHTPPLVVFSLQFVLDNKIFCYKIELLCAVRWDVEPLGGRSGRCHAVIFLPPVSNRKDTLKLPQRTPQRRTPSATSPRWGQKQWKVNRVARLLPTRVDCADILWKQVIFRFNRLISLGNILCVEE